MKALGMWERLSDRLNPIVVKELRQAVRSRFVVTVLLLFLLVQVGYLGIHLVLGQVGGSMESLEFEAGRDVFAALQGILSVTCMLFIPLYTGVRLSAERSEINVDLMFITTLRPRSIISGKLAAALVLAVMIFSACAPFMVFTYFLRGVDWPSIFYVVALDFVVVVATVQLAIFIAVIPANRGVKALLGLIGLVLLLLIIYMTVAATVMLLLFGLGNYMGQPDFWPTVGMGAVGIFAFIGLFFSWSIALIMPPSANRALPMRVFALCIWLASGLVCGVGGWMLQGEWPMYVWVISLGALSALFLMTAINEREHWGPRVTKAIPRRWWLRLPAFFLYSGAAGGILFALLLFGLTAAGVLLWREISPVPVIWAGYDIMALQTMGMMFLYTYCYGLTAAFVRRKVLKLQPTYTWILMIVLMALGSVIPLLVSFLISFRDWRYESHYLCMLGNPVTAMEEFASLYYFNHQSAYLIFASVWAGLITVANVPWIAQQIRRFRPFVPSGARPAKDSPEFLLSPTPMETTKTIQ